MWGCSPHAPGNSGCCIPNCASRRRKKAKKRKYFAPPFHKKYAQFYARRASFGIKRPAFTRGHGGGVSPHIQLHTSQICVTFMLERASCKMQHPCCRAGRAEKPHRKKGCFFKRKRPRLCATVEGGFVQKGCYSCVASAGKLGISGQTGVCPASMASAILLSISACLRSFAAFSAGGSF